jgi:hypothetical protein
MQVQTLLALVRAAAPTNRAVRAAVDGVAYRVTGYETIFARPLKAWIARDPGNARERLRLDVNEGETPGRFLWDLQATTMSALDPHAESYSDHPMSAADLVIPHGPIVARGRSAGWGPWSDVEWSRWDDPSPTTSLFRLGHHGWGLVQQFWSDEGALQGVHLTEPVPFDDETAFVIPDRYRRVSVR